MGVIWDSDKAHAQQSPALIKSVLAAVSRIKAITVKPFQRLLGLLAAASNMTLFGLLYMRPFQWWLRIKGFFPAGQSFLHDQGYAQMPSYFGDMEETLVSIPGTCVGGVIVMQGGNERCFPDRLGSDPGGLLSSRSVERAS